MTATCKIWFIGHNRQGQFGLGYSDSSQELLECTHTSMQKVFHGEDFYIFADNDFKNICGAG